MLCEILIELTAVSFGVMREAIIFLPYVDILSAGTSFLESSIQKDENVSLEIYKTNSCKYPNSVKCCIQQKTKCHFNKNHNELQKILRGSEDGAFVESKLYDINPIIDR